MTDKDDGNCLPIGSAQLVYDFVNRPIKTEDSDFSGVVSPTKEVIIVINLTNLGTVSFVVVAKMLAHCT